MQTIRIEDLVPENVTGTGKIKIVSGRKRISLPAWKVRRFGIQWVESMLRDEPVSLRFRPIEELWLEAT